MVSRIGNGLQASSPVTVYIHSAYDRRRLGMYELQVSCAVTDYTHTQRTVVDNKVYIGSLCMYQLYNYIFLHQYCNIECVTVTFLFPFVFLMIIIMFHINLVQV